MAEKIARIYCPTCESHQKCVTGGASHLLHFFLTICTLGLWLLPWMVIGSNASKRWHCDKCGSRVRADATGTAYNSAAYARKIKMALGVFLGIPALFIVLAIMTPSTDHEPPKWVIPAAVDVRAGPGAEHFAIGHRKGMDAVNVDLERDGWSQVSYSVDGRTHKGWIRSDLLGSKDAADSTRLEPQQPRIVEKEHEAAQQPTAAKKEESTPIEPGLAKKREQSFLHALLNGDGDGKRVARWVLPKVINVRAGPGTEHAVAGKLSGTSSVTVVAELDGWSGVRYQVKGDPREGWIRNDLLGTETAAYAADRTRICKGKMPPEVIGKLYYKLEPPHLYVHDWAWYAIDVDYKKQIAKFSRRCWASSEIRSASDGRVLAEHGAWRGWTFK